MRLPLIAAVLAWFGIASSCFQFANAQQANQKTAADVFKNIQVLKRVPADQWFDTMAFIAGSLGVTCDHCHSSSFEVDEGNPAKLKAREMMRMVDEINRNHFEASTVVTCNTCHRGTLKPQNAPIPDAAHWMKAAEKASPLPSSDEILARYRKLIRVGMGDAVLTQAVSLEIATYGGAGPARLSSFDLLLDGHDKVRASTRDGQLSKTLVKNGQEAWINDGSGWRILKAGEESNIFDAVKILSPDQVGNVENAGAVFEDNVDGQRAYVIPVDLKDEKNGSSSTQVAENFSARESFFPASMGTDLPTSITPTIEPSGRFSCRLHSTLSMLAAPV